MEIDIFFWWTIVSTIIGVILLGISIWQISENKNREIKNKSQVKIWMQDANGIQEALARIVRDNLDKRYSSTDDICNAIWAIHSTTKALYQSLYEERCVDEDDYAKTQRDFSEQAKMNVLQKSMNIEKIEPK